MNCTIRGCRRLETRCLECKRLVCEINRVEDTWNLVKETAPPAGMELLVYKHYLDQEFKNGGYSGPYFETESFVTLDTFNIAKTWEKGGVVTHWMHKPEKPL